MEKPTNDMDSIFLDEAVFHNTFAYRVIAIAKEVGDYIYRDDIIVILDYDGRKYFIKAPFNLYLDTIFIKAGDFIRRNDLVCVVCNLSSVNDFDNLAFENNIPSLQKIEISIIKDDFDGIVTCKFQRVGISIWPELKHYHFYIYDIKSNGLQRGIECFGITFISENGRPFIEFMVPQLDYHYQKERKLFSYLKEA